MPNKKLLKESFEKLCNELKNDLNGKSIKNDITSNYLLDDSSEFKCEISLFMSYYVTEEGVI